MIAVTSCRLALSRQMPLFMTSRIFKDLRLDATLNVRFVGGESDIPLMTAAAAVGPFRSLSVMLFRYRPIANELTESRSKAVMKKLSYHSLRCSCDKSGLSRVSTTASLNARVSGRCRLRRPIRPELPDSCAKSLDCSIWSHSIAPTGLLSISGLYRISPDFVRALCYSGTRRDKSAIRRSCGVDAFATLQISVALKPSYPVPFGSSNIQSQWRRLWQIRGKYVSIETSCSVTEKPC